MSGLQHPTYKMITGSRKRLWQFRKSVKVQLLESARLSNNKPQPAGRDNSNYLLSNSNYRQKPMRRNKRKQANPKKRNQDEENMNESEVSDFIDLDYWQREENCCGAIFRGRNNEIMVDVNLVTPCPFRVPDPPRQNEEERGPETSENKP